MLVFKDDTIYHDGLYTILKDSVIYHDERLMVMIDGLLYDLSVHVKVLEDILEQCKGRYFTIPEEFLKEI
jgi:hypothetical protein